MFILRHRRAFEERRAEGVVTTCFAGPCSDSLGGAGTGRGRELMDVGTEGREAPRRRGGLASSKRGAALP